MKTSEIQVGVEYALGSGHTVERGWARHAIVLEKYVERQVRPKDRGGNRVTFDGISVQHINNDGTRGTTVVLAPSQIGMTWAAYQDLRVDVEQRRAERAAEQKAAQLEAIRRIKACQPRSETVSGLTEKLTGYGCPSLETVADLVEAAHRKGARG